MKKILLMLMMIPFFSMGQMSREYLSDDIDLKLEYVKTPTKTTNNSVYVHHGVPLLVAGGMFTLLGLTTPRETEFVNGVHQTKPFYKQGAQFFSTITGGVLIVSGIVVTIGQ